MTRPELAPVSRAVFLSNPTWASVLLIHQDTVAKVLKLQQPIIEVAWRHAGEEGKIHYRAKRPDGSDRHLIARQGEALYELLEQHLAAIGYTGPESAGEQTREH